MAITFKNLSRGGGGGSVETKTYSLPLGEPSWLRIAKATDITKNSSGVFTFDCYGTKEDGGKDILTTSVFSVSCGLDHSGNFVSDVLPINQAPEITGSSGSGGAGSGGGGTGSGDAIALADGSGTVGSGVVGTHGLCSIKLEHFEGETYVCGLVNYPAVEMYASMHVEMKIENNLNFENLEQLEVVNLDEVIYGADQVVSEGTILEQGKDYEFKVRCTLADYVNGIENGIDNVVDISFKEGSGTGIVSHSSSGNIRIGEHTFDSINEMFDFDELNTSGVAYIGESVILSYINYAFCRHCSFINLTKVSGKLFIDDYAGTRIGVLTLNGKVVLDISQTDQREYTFENLIVGKDVLAFDNGSAQMSSISSVELDYENTEVEFTIPYQDKEETKTISSVNITNNDTYNFSVLLNTVTKHYTSDSYDLFSAYALLKQVGRHTSEISNLQDNYMDLKKREIYPLKDKLARLNIADLNKASASFNMKEIPDYFLQENRNIEYGYYPLTEKIGDNAFFRSTIKYVNLPTCKEICESAFSNSNLIKCDLGDNLQSIGSYAFNSLNLKYIIVPPTVVNIGYYIVPSDRTIAFVSWSEEDNVNKPYISNTMYFNVTKDDIYDTNWCLYVKEGESYTLATIDNYLVDSKAFEDTGNYVCVPEDIHGTPVTKIGNRAFSYVSNLRSIDIPESVKEIGERAFIRCNNLTSFSCKANIIGRCAFYENYCLIEIHLGDVQHFNAQTFYDCNSLGDIWVASNQMVTLSSNDIFFNAGVNNNNNGIINLHVKPEFVDLYYNDENWQQLINEGKINIVGDYEG